MDSQVVATLLMRGQRVVTFAMVDRVHQRPEGTAKRTFDENRNRFAEVADYFTVGRDEIRTDLSAAFSRFAPSGTLLTRRGYLKLTKSLTDDRAWAVSLCRAGRRGLAMVLVEEAAMPSLMYLRNSATSEVTAMNSVEARRTVAAFPGEWSYNPPSGTKGLDGEDIVVPVGGLRVPGPEGLIAAGDPRRHGPNLDSWQKPGAVVPERVSYLAGPI